MELHTSSIHRHLESELKIMGIEAHDLLLILILASIMNLIFGQTSLNLIMVFGVPGLLSIVLVLGKRNKPDQFLVHWLKYQFRPGFYSASQERSSHVK